MTYLIWSNEHGQWWGPDYRGYTRTIEKAGTYTAEEAERIVRNANVGSVTNEVMVPAPTKTDADGPSDRFDSRPHHYHLTVIHPHNNHGGTTTSGVNVTIPEPINTHNGVATAIGAAAQILGADPSQVVILNHIELDC